MNAYIYYDTKEKVIIFNCFADDILSADKIYKSVFAKDVAKQGHISCRIEFDRRNHGSENDDNATN